MDEIEEFEKFLGLIGQDYTNAQLRQLRREMHARAELLLDTYLDKMRSKRQKAAVEALELDASAVPSNPFVAVRLRVHPGGSAPNTAKIPHTT